MKISVHRLTMKTNLFLVKSQYQLICRSSNKIELLSNYVWSSCGGKNVYHFHIVGTAIVPLVSRSCLVQGPVQGIPWEATKQAKQVAWVVSLLATYLRQTDNWLVYQKQMCSFLQSRKSNKSCLFWTQTKAVDFFLSGSVLVTNWYFL